MLMLKTPFYLIVALCCSALCITACQPKNSSNEQHNNAAAPDRIELIAQDLSPVKIGSLPIRFEFTGNIQSVEQTTLQSQVSAIAEAVMVDVGQPAHIGQILLKLNNRDNSARLAQARANLLAAQAQANQAQRIMTRKQRLLQQGFIAKVEFEQSQLDYQNQQENVKVQQANVNIASKAELDGTIRSPINGIISKRQVDVGQVVNTGQTLFEIVNPAQLELHAQIPLEAQSALKIGQNLQFKLPGNDQNYSARITRVAPVANQNNRQIEFFANPEQNLPTLSIGSYVQGQLLSSTKQTGQIIALDSIQNANTNPFVWIVRANKLLKVNIQIVSRDELQNLALVQGLHEGDRISQVVFQAQDQNKTVVVAAP